MSSQHQPLPLLDSLVVSAHEDAALPIKVCAEHLALLGARMEPPREIVGPGKKDSLLAGELAMRLAAEAGGTANADEALDCAIWWQPPGESGPGAVGSEMVVQAISGLMALHGRDKRAPRRLGLDVASVAAGTIAAQGVLAALIAGRRGYKVRRVEASVLQAALTFLYHHLAIATCEQEFTFPTSGSAPGPPFCTADGQWVELEVLSGESWFAFWGQLGVARSELGVAWLPFVYRYLAGTCALPESLHLATRRHTLADIRRAADSSGVAICRVRTYPELLAEFRPPEDGSGQNVESGLRIGAPWVLTPAPPSAVCGSAPSSRQITAPLAGMRVVEVTSRLQGPLAGLLLGMLGADVIKVEPPGGDFGRHTPPLVGSVGAAYLAYNRGKQVIELDYKQAEGRARLAELVAEADVFLHNWRSSRAEQLGFDFERLSQSHPSLVYAHASAWGQTAEEPAPIAGDFLVQAHAASGYGLNPTDETPFPSRVTLVDVMGGLLACEGVLAGLYLRERTGRGCRVDTSLLAGAMALQSDVLKAAADGREWGRRSGRPLWGVLERPVETANGFIIMSLQDEQAHRRLSKVCGLGTSGNGGGVELICQRLRSRPAAEWESLLLEAGIPAAVVRTNLSSLPCDPRIAPLVERVENACWLPAAPWRFVE